MTDYIYPDTKCIKVVDGDTIDAYIQIPMGFKITASTTQRLRLMGIDTPELRPRRGTDEEKAAEKEAAKKAKQYVSNMILDKKIKIQTYKADSFGRYLADIWITIDGIEIHLNQDLLDRGYAVEFKK